VQTTLIMPTQAEKSRAWRLNVKFLDDPLFVELVKKKKNANLFIHKGRTHRVEVAICLA